MRMRCLLKKQAIKNARFSFNERINARKCTVEARNRDSEWHQSWKVL